MPDSSAHERLIQDYLSGRLSEEQATALEERSLTDEQLGTELALALDIKATGEGSEGWGRAVPEAAFRWRRWAWSAAAALVVLALGLGFLLSVDSGGREQEPLRGGEAALDLSLSRDDSSVTVSWPEIDGADGGYRVELFRPDGTLVSAGETFGRQLTIAVPDAASADPLFARVQALGPLRDLVAESSLEAVPAGGGGDGG